MKVDDDPVTVQLLFEPSGRPADKQDYYLNEKDNVCVVCGTDDSYIRKNIIPREYRKYELLSVSVFDEPGPFIPEISSN